MIPIISKNRYLNALFLLIIFSAITHLIILFALAFMQKNAQIINYFNILDLELLFPNWSLLHNLPLATLVALGIYLIFFHASSKNVR